VLILQDAYQAYAVLSMCRMVATLHTGEIVSKPAAARWARAGVARPHAKLINAAPAWQPGIVFGRLVETTTFLRFALAEAKQFEEGGSTLLRRECPFTRTANAVKELPTLTG
jgi:hypothetical protein